MSDKLNIQEKSVILKFSDPLLQVLFIRYFIHYTGNYNKSFSHHFKSTTFQVRQLVCYEYPIDPAKNGTYSRTEQVFLITSTLIKTL